MVDLFDQHIQAKKRNLA